MSVDGLAKTIGQGALASSREEREWPANRPGTSLWSSAVVDHRAKRIIAVGRCFGMGKDVFCHP